MASHSTPFLQKKIAAQRVQMLLGGLFWPIVLISWIPIMSMDLLYLLAFIAPGTQGAIPIPFLNSFALMHPIASVILVVLGLASMVAHSVTSDDNPRLTALIPAILPLLTIFIITLSGTIAAAIDNHSDRDTGFAAFTIFVYIATVIASLLAFSKFGRISDSFFLPFFFLLLIDAMFLSSGQKTAIFSPIFSNYRPAASGIILLAMLSYMSRAIYIAIKDNSDISIRSSLLATKAAKDALKLWWPMMLFFIFANVFYHVIDKVYVRPCVIQYLDSFDYVQEDAAAKDITNEATAYDICPESAQQDAPSAEQSQTVKGRTVSVALSDMIEREGNKLIATTDAVVAESVVNIKDGTKEISEVGPQIAENALPVRLPGTETRKCKWYDVGCLLSNGVKSMVNSAYSKQRVQALELIQAETKKIAAETEIGAEEKGNRLQTVVSDRVKETVILSQSLLRKSASAVALISVILFVYTLFVLLKSYLVVFARVLYQKGRVRPIPADGVKQAHGKISTPGNTFDITADTTTGFYAIGSAVGPSVIERKRIPYWYRLPVARILCGRYILCYIKHGEQGQEDCSLRVDEPAELVAWEMTAGEEVIINLRDFVAMSEEVRIGSKISITLSSLIFGRIIYHYATGPGTIIMQVRAAPVSGENPAASQPLRLNGIVSWSTRSQFNVISSHTKVDTFFSGCCLKATKDSRIVYDTSQTRAKSGIFRGIWHFGRAFLLPF